MRISAAKSRKTNVISARQRYRALFSLDTYGKDESDISCIKTGDHPLELPPKRRDWHLTHLQARAILLLAMGALTALVIWLIVSHSATLVGTMKDLIGWMHS